MPKNGNYARKPVVEIEELLEAYALDREMPYDEILDWLDEDTAVESPQAMGTRGPYKRSGEYVIHMTDEFQQRLEFEKNLAGKGRK